jgi:hypothetical protein
MVRTQIQLTAGQHARLRKLARQLGVSLSEAVRRCVEERLQKEERSGGRAGRVRAALAVVGKYRDPDGVTRVAREHDRYFADASKR